MVRASQWEIDAASLLWLNTSNALNTVKIGVSITGGLCGAVHLHIGDITKRSRAAIDKRSLIWGSSTRIVSKRALSETQKAPSVLLPRGTVTTAGMLLRQR
jgi:hypothetical protein